jgi:hypothetical protein
VTDWQIISIVFKNPMFSELCALSKAELFVRRPKYTIQITEVSWFALWMIKMTTRRQQTEAWRWRTRAQGQNDCKKRCRLCKLFAQCITCLFWAVNPRPRIIPTLLYLTCGRKTISDYFCTNCQIWVKISYQQAGYDAFIVTVPTQMVLLLRVYRERYDIEEANNPSTNYMCCATKHIILYPAGSLYTRHVKHAARGLHAALCKAHLRPAQRIL